MTDNGNGPEEIPESGIIKGKSARASAQNAKLKNAPETETPAAEKAGDALNADEESNKQDMAEDHEKEQLSENIEDQEATQENEGPDGDDKEHGGAEENLDKTIQAPDDDAEKKKDKDQNGQETEPERDGRNSHLFLMEEAVKILEEQKKEDVRLMAFMGLSQHGKSTLLAGLNKDEDCQGLLDVQLVESGAIQQTPMGQVHLTRWPENVKGKPWMAVDFAGGDIRYINTLEDTDGQGGKKAYWEDLKKILRMVDAMFFLISIPDIISGTTNDPVPETHSPRRVIEKEAGNITLIMETLLNEMINCPGQKEFYGPVQILFTKTDRLNPFERHKGDTSPVRFLQAVEAVKSSKTDRFNQHYWDIQDSFYEYLESPQKLLGDFFPGLYRKLENRCPIWNVDFVETENKEGHEDNKDEGRYLRGIKNCLDFLTVPDFPYKHESKKWEILIEKCRE